MKRIVVALMTVVLLCTLVTPAFAADPKNAFENVVMNANEDEFGYIANESGRTRNDTTISYMEAYGCGNGAMGDAVQFKNLDFGENGADKMYMNLCYGNESNSTNLEVYIDEVAGEPAAKYNIGYTGGWESTYAEEFETDISVPAGTHDIIVLFTDETGSFNYIRFDEAPPAPAEEAPAEAPQTADPLTITAAIAAASAAGAVVLKKRAK